MMDNEPLNDFQVEYTFSDNAIARLDRQLALLFSTREGSMPLDREFGIKMDFLDRPPEVARSLFTAEVTKKVAMFIPQVRVQEVKWAKLDGGKMVKKVVITNA